VDQDSIGSSVFPVKMAIESRLRSSCQNMQERLFLGLSFSWMNLMMWRLLKLKIDLLRSMGGLP